MAQETRAGYRVGRRSGPQSGHQTPRAPPASHSCPPPSRSYAETPVPRSQPTIPIQPPAPVILPSLGERAHHPPR